ncbi:MAG: choice-of-anchor J domain-containing protein [Bacteroidota bacterium]|nr:choice-of-anchor J domain-containing protein [Bacteroidota bacterium]
MKNRYNIYKVLALAMALFGISLPGLAQNIWINEVHYDNYGTDEGEFIEIVMEDAGSYTLSDFEIYLYNGNNGGSYDSKSLDLYTEANQVDNFTFYYYDYPENGIQNGAPDGIALAYQGTLISGQFLSYEGSMTATDGPAAGVTSTDIGVEEPGEIGESLQLSGSGTTYAEFSWNPPAAETKGMINTGQAFGGPMPEPSSYPTDFTALAAGLSVELSWTDATGEQLPAAYLVLASTNSSFTTPVDGTPVPDDTDLSDGNGALNVNYGVESCNFGNLESNTQYYFIIYSYTNAAANIDYKTDGNPPEADVTTPDVLILNYENFNDISLGTWSQYSVTGPDQFWEAQEQYGIDNSPNAVMNGYEGGAVENDDWLISPELQVPLDTYNPTLEFWSARNYDGPDIEVKVSNDYTGSGDPNAASWQDVDAELSSGNWSWTYSGSIDLSDLITEESFFVAFRYTSTSSEAPTWKLDEILITAEVTIGIPENPEQDMLQFYPNPAQHVIYLEELPVDASIMIYDLSGRLVKSASNGPNSLEINDLNPGIYFLKASSEKNSSQGQKLIVY